jgi:serine/threonine protein kinase
MTPDREPTSKTTPARRGLALIAVASLLAVAFALVEHGLGAALLVLAAIAVGAALMTFALRRPRVEASKRLGPYTLEEKIGEGGMGVVYRASHERLRRPAAVKLLAPDRAGERSLERFEREVQLTSMLSHPNTIAIYDFGRTDEGTFYYAMEYLDGLDLERLVEREGPQPPARVAHLLAQLSGALVEAHGAGLVHRDVKPANVMVCERGGASDVVKLLDFGLIKDLACESDADPHSIEGTPSYISPEAVTAPETVDARSDLYAVGAVGYFLLTGAAPFSGKSVIEVCSHHIHSEPVAPSARLGHAVPRELEELILRCLAKSPDDRPADAATLERAFGRLARSWTERAPIERAPVLRRAPADGCALAA